MKNNRKCLICGKGYHYCPTCPDDSEKPNWYFVFCSEKCNQLNNVISNYSVNNITKEQASKLLEKIDFSLDDIAIKENKECIEEIMKSQKNVTVEKTVEEQETTKEDSLSEDSESSVEEKSATQTETYKKSKRYRG